MIKRTRCCSEGPVDASRGIFSPLGSCRQRPSCFNGFASLYAEGGVVVSRIDRKIGEKIFRNVKRRVKRGDNIYSIFLNVEQERGNVEQ